MKGKYIPRKKKGKVTLKKLSRAVKHLQGEAQHGSNMVQFNGLCVQVVGLPDTTLWNNYAILTPCRVTQGVGASNITLDNMRSGGHMWVKSMDLKCNIFNDLQATVNTIGAPNLEVRIVVVRMKGFEGGTPLSGNLAQPALAPLFEFSAVGGLTAPEFYQKLAVSQQAKGIYHIMYDKIVSLNVPYTSVAIPANGTLTAATATISAPTPTVHNLHYHKKMNHKVTFVGNDNSGNSAVPIDGEIFVLAFCNNTSNRPGLEAVCMLEFEFS